MRGSTDQWRLPALRTVIVAGVTLLVAGCTTAPATRQSAGTGTPPGPAVVTGAPRGQQTDTPPVSPHERMDHRDTEQLCHDLLHRGNRPSDAARDPGRCL